MDPLAKLAPREWEVFLLVANGASNKHVAAKLGISLKTVQTHRAKLNEKLDVHSPVELVTLAARCGLVGRPQVNCETMPRFDVGVALLQVLGDGAATGLELVERVERRTGGRFRPTTSGAYLALRTLEAEGLVAGFAADGVRKYRLMPKGTGQAAEDRAIAADLFECVPKLLDRERDTNPEIVPGKV